ncbi:MAG: agmatinase [Planctomycetota bacterium]|nr:agmatinase [Planctomycetota bacterium]
MSDSAGNFLDLPSEFSDPATAKYIILPVPYEGTVTFGRGASGGPAAIIAASHQVEWFDEELLGEFYHAGIATLEPVAPADTPTEQMDRIRTAAQPHVQAGKFLLTLGGEHSITVPLVEAAADHYGGISVVQIDAHADLRDTYNGTKHSHACVMRRILEITDRIAQVGIRSFSREEYDACTGRAADFITPKMAADGSMSLTTGDPDWIDRVLALLGDKVYLTVDIDGFDPSEAPGTGTPEPGGLTWPQVTGLIRRLAAERSIVAADIVEVSPVPGSRVTEFLAARLAYKIIAYTQTDRD